MSTAPSDAAGSVAAADPADPGPGTEGDGLGGDESVETDGRRRRRERNRLAVVDALLDLYREGNLRPGTDEIATRAGLSPRSLFRYFDDVDDLTGAAVARQLARARHLLPIAATPDAPFAERVDALVAQRFRLFDQVRHAATVSRLRSPFHPLLGAELAQNRTYLREQLRTLFATELAPMDRARAGSTIAAADVMSSFESYQLLRDAQGLGPTRARSVMAEALTAILGPGGDPRPTASPDPSGGAGNR